MNIFEMLPRKLIAVYHQQESEDIEGDIFTWFETSNGKFGFKFMRNYSGKVAHENNRGFNSHQGLFDIQVRTGSKVWKANQKDGYKASHRDCFRELVTHCTEEQCLNVWRGESPLEVGENELQIEALATMSLLMFEQEMNYVSGKKFPWQYNRESNFKPLIRTPDRRRPRDMLMGYIRQAFSHGIDNLGEIKYWMKKKPGTVWFFDKDESRYGYSSYPKEWKKLFIELEEMGGGLPVLSEEVANAFFYIIDKEEVNPNFVKD